MKKIFGFLIFFVVLIISNSEFLNSSSSSSCGCIAVPTFNSTGTNLSKASDTCANESLAVLVANLPSVVCGCLLPSSSATASGSASPSATASASKEATISANPTETSIATLSATRSSRPSLSATTSRSFTSSSTSTKSSRPSPSGTATSSESGKATDTRTSTPSPSPTPTPTPTQTPTPSPSPTPSKTPSTTPSNLPPSATSSISESPTKTPSPTPTPSGTPSPSTTPSITSSATSTESGHATVSSLPSNSATITASVSASASPSSSSSATTSSTAFDSATATFSSHASISAISSLTATRSAEPTSSSSSTKSSLPSSSAISTFTATASVTPTPSITPSVTPSVTPSGTPSPSTTGSALPTVPIIVMGFEISNLDNVGIYYSSSSATSHLRDAVVTGIRSKGASVYLTNVTLSNVMEVTDPLEKKTLFQDGRRRLSLGRGHARYLAATQTISVRAFIRMESFSQAQAVVYVLALNETELSGIVLTSLLGSDYDRYKSASVKVHELIAPYVYPRYIYPPPPDALLGLSVLEWVGVGIGCLIFLIGGLALGFFAGRRTAPPPIAPIAPKIVGRGRTRKYSVKGFKIKKSERNLINLNAPPLDDGLVENSDDEEEEHTGNEEAIVNSESTVAINTIDDISITTRKEKDNENQKEDEEEEEVQEDVQEVENPMVKARTRSRLAVVSVNMDTVKRSGIDVGEVISSRPIERIQFDFPVSMTTNPYHLLFLGEPNFIELVDREISRATALAAKALSAIEKVQNDILERRKTLARGGIAASVASNRLLDMVRSIEASLPSGRSDAGARRAEVAAINVAKNDKQMLEIRHSKYLELIEDLNRLKKQMSTEERKSRAERIPGLKSLLAFAPTTRQTNSGFQQNDDDDDDDIATKNTLQPLSVKTRMLAARGRKGRRGGRGGRRRGGDPASGAGASNEEAEDDAWDEDEDNHDEI